MDYAPTLDGDWPSYLQRVRAQSALPGGAAGRAMLSRAAQRALGAHDPNLIPLAAASSASGPFWGPERLGAGLDWLDVERLCAAGALLRPLGGHARRRPDLAGARRALERARAALLRGEGARAANLIDRALGGANGWSGDSDEPLFRLIEGAIFLGARAGAPDDPVDLARAYRAFTAAGSEARRRLTLLEERRRIGAVKASAVDAAEHECLFAELAAARAAFCAGSYQRALSHANRAAEQHPGVAAAHLLAARAHAARDDSEASLAAAAHALAADEAYGPIIAADPLFAPYSAELTDIAETLGRQADALRDAVAPAREQAVRAQATLQRLAGAAPKAAPAPVSLAAETAAGPSRLRAAKREIAELWDGMATLELAYRRAGPRTPEAVDLERRRRRRRGGRRFALRSLAAAAACVALGGLAGRLAAEAADWLGDGTGALSANVPNDVIAALAAMLAAALAAVTWSLATRDSRAQRAADSAWEAKEDALQTGVKTLHRGFDALNAVLKAPRHAAFFTDTAALFRAHLGGPTHLDHADAPTAEPKR